MAQHQRRRLDRRQQLERRRPPPGTAGNSRVANFSLGSIAGYGVTNCQSASTIVVGNDRVVLNGGGIAAGVFTYSPIFLNSLPGQSSNLSLQSYGINMINASMSIGGSGTSTLNLLNCTASQDNGAMWSGGISVGGTTGSTTYFNQIGGSISTVNGGSTGFAFGGDGAVTVNIDGGTLYSDRRGFVFGGAGGVSVSLNSAVLNTSLYDSTRDITFGSESGPASATATNTTINALRLSGFAVGTLSSQYVLSASGNNYTAGVGPGVPFVTGGGNGRMAATNCTINAATGVFVGGSSGNGTLLASGPACTITTQQLAVGYANGTGRFSLDGGAKLIQFFGPTSAFAIPTFIGGSGGTGTMIVSGTATQWNCSAGTITVGGDSVGSGVGLLQLDHNAVLTDPGFPATFYNLDIPGLLKLTAGGTVQVLSGAKANLQTMTEVPGSTLIFGVDGPNAADNGQINLTGTVTFAGTLGVVFENGYRPAVGQAFQLFTFNSSSGQFSTLNFPPGYAFDTSRLYAAGTVTVTAVPEPATIGAAVFVVAMTNRRPKRRDCGLPRRCAE